MRELRPVDAIALYEDALRGQPEGSGGLHAVGEDGSRRRLPLSRWLGTPDEVEEELLARASGPVLDIGCGAGRHVVALGRRGVRAVGVELAPGAAAIARSRGATVIEGSIFDRPLEGGWATALLIDGNIGIGGDAAALLRRTAELLAPGGQALVELEPPARAPRTARVRLESPRAVSDWVPWEFVSADEIDTLAEAAGLSVVERWERGGRWFALLRKERERAALLVPALVCGGALLTLAVGLVAKAAGSGWGAPAQPLVAFLRPALSTWAIPGAAVLAVALLLAERLRRATVGAWAFAAATFALTLATRLALNVFRGGPEALAQPFVVRASGEGRTEYLPGLRFLDGGVGHFLAHFPQLIPSLPVQASGHPPGLLLTLHYLGIDNPGGLAALTILVGAAATPLLYLLGRELAPEGEARLAALLFVFVPTSLLYGATSGDALFAALGVLAAVGLLARRRLARLGGALALALAAFFSWALLAVGAWSALVRWRRAGVTAALRLALLCATVLTLAYLALYALTGFDPIAAVRATDAAYGAGIARLRPYPFWLFGSPAAFLLLLGPVAWFAARSLAAKEASAVALALVVAISALGGYTKAESERIWLFLVPFACLAAARSLPARWVPAVLTAATAQAVIVETLLFTKW